MPRCHPSQQLRGCVGHCGSWIRAESRQSTTPLPTTLYEIVMTPGAAGGRSVNVVETVKVPGPTLNTEGVNVPSVELMTSCALHGIVPVATIEYIALPSESRPLHLTSTFPKRGQQVSCCGHGGKSRHSVSHGRQTPVASGIPNTKHATWFCGGISTNVNVTVDVPVGTEKLPGVICPSDEVTQPCVGAPGLLMTTAN